MGQVAGVTPARSVEAAATKDKLPSNPCQRRLARHELESTSTLINHF